MTYNVLHNMNYQTEAQDMADNQEGPSNIKQEFNLGRIGLDMDSSVNQVQKGKLSYALNAALENFDANSVNYQNEPGNEACLEFPAGYQLIGTHFIQEKNKHIFFLANPETGGSEIGYMENNDCVYRVLCTPIPDTDLTVCANSTCLNFDINYPIHKAVHKITNCSTEVYWTDGLNPRRFINIDQVPYIAAYLDEDNCNPQIQLPPTLDCNKLKVQPNFSIPSLEIADIVVGGDIQAGTYQFAIQYCNASGDAYTSYYSITNPTSIANTEITTPDFQYSVGKSIVINIDNIDITGYFQYFNIAIIKTINGGTSVELMGTYNIQDKDRTITYTGQALTNIPLSLADVLEKFPYYEVAQDVTNVQDVIVWDNLTSIDRINYQSIASQIQLQWETYKLPANNTYADGFYTANLRGYLRDEVYAFEIVFLLDNGKQTDGFHIPGRAPVSTDLTPVYNTNADFIGEGTVAPYWKIYNTGSVSTTYPAPIGDAGKIGEAYPYQSGDFSYWESTDEYPCNVDVWGDLAGEKIRHHKFPDVLVSPYFETPPITYVGGQIEPVMQASNAIYPIGVKIDVQQVGFLIQSSSLTNAEKDAIVGFKIVRGNRSTNKSIIAKGILRNVGKYKREETEYYYPNYPYNDLAKDPFLLQDSNAYMSQCDTYKVTATVDGSFQYTNCNTGEVTSAQFTTATTEICSLTLPVVNEGAATFQNVTAETFIISAQNGCTGPFSFRPAPTFSYVNPVTLATEFITVPKGSSVTVNSVGTPLYISGCDKFTIVSGTSVNMNCFPDQLDGFNNSESPYRQVFNSPETSFGQPTLGSVLKLESVLFGSGRAHFVQVKKHSMYRLLTIQAQIDALNSSKKIADLGGFNATAMFTAYQTYLQIYVNGATRRNFAYSFNSISSYDYSADIQNNQGIKQRELDKYQYVFPGVQNVGDNHDLNNWNRESSVYTKSIENRTGVGFVAPLPYPNQTNSLVVAGTSQISDNSRFTLSERGHCGTPEFQEPIKVVSYYGSIKTINNAQWGQIYSYQTIDTGFQRIFGALPANDSEVIFGGDTFIGKFGFKTKLPFFIDNRVGAPDDSDIFYDEIGNVAYPQYWYSARSVLYDYYVGGTLMKNIISVKAHYLDCPNDTKVDDPNTTTTTSSTTPAPGTTLLGNQNYVYDGKMYTFAYGIPYYYVETSINIDLRQAFNNLEGDFYPHVSSGIPDTWFQESVVPITFDNTYYYNTTFSKQNTENFFSHLPSDWKQQLCYTYFPFRAIYSDRQESYSDNRINSWLIYRPISFFDFPQNYGNLISLDGIQNRATLARFENKTLLYGNMLTVNTSNPQAAYLGNPSLFSSVEPPPIDYAETDLGYVGSQNKFLLKIPQGQITVDAKRGQIFLITGTQATDISGYGSGLNRFFTDHLSFEILRYYPTVDIDNHFKNIGLHGVYDSKYDRVIITKLDYIPQPDKNIFYDDVAKEFYINQPTAGNTSVKRYVEVTDVNYFCNKSWTVSFNFNTKSWVSFHTYIPNFYIGENNFFYSGLNEGCDISAVAVTEIPSSTTTTTTTVIYYCNLSGTAVVTESPCTLEGTAACTDCTTTTTSTTTTAAPTTVRLDWRVGNQSGGALTIFNNVASQLLSITSTAGSVQSGTIYPLISELPYTIRGEWVSGSGNIIQFNLCDVTAGGTIYTSGPITSVEGYEDYLVTPTPVYGLVNLTAQNVTPPTCPV